MRVQNLGSSQGHERSKRGSRSKLPDFDLCRLAQHFRSVSQLSGACWKDEAEGGSMTYAIATDLKCSIHFCSCIGAAMESESVSGFSSGESVLENFMDVFRGDSDSCVLDLDDDFSGSARLQQ